MNKSGQVTGLSVVVAGFSLRKEGRRDEKANANWGVMEEIPAV